MDFWRLMDSSLTGNISDVQAFNSSGGLIASTYSASDGAAMFASFPATVKYNYDTGHGKMDVTISGIVSGVAIDPENFSDVFGPYLYQFDTDGDGILSEAEIANVKEIYLDESGVESLEGIRYFTNLERLYCRSNAITGALDLHGFTKLVEISCRSNMITSLDLSGCTALTTVYARSNKLSELNITGCNALEILNCGTNADDTEDHTNRIARLDLSGKTNLKELTCKRNGLASLDISDCTALISLDCCFNQIQTLNTGNNTALKYLECWNNKLTSLDVSKNTGLEWLDCGSNDIKTLDVTHNTALKHLECYSCRLNELDLSANTELEHLDCGGIWYNPESTYNRLSSLNLASNTKLKTLICDRNLLTELDISMLTQLKRLECQSNDLTTLDLSNNPLLTALSLDKPGSNELPLLRLTYSADSAMPFRTDMKYYTGPNYTNITSVKAYTSTWDEILTTFMTDGTASFVNMPVKVVYTYDTGYTGSADIVSDMAVTLVPASEDFFVPLVVVSREPYPVPFPSKEIEYVDRQVVSVETMYIDRLIISREVVVSKETVYVDRPIVSPVISPETRYVSGSSSGGCNSLSGAIMLAGLLGLTGYTAAIRKH